MGDRANVLVGETFDGKFEGVYLYTHWGGSDLPATLQRAIKKRWRWNDSSYLARIIFCEMVSGEEMGETGYGISVNIGDGADRILRVNVETQAIERIYRHWSSETEEIRQSWTFDGYCGLDEDELDRVWYGQEEK